MPQSSPRNDFFEADTPDSTTDRPHIRGHLHRRLGAACDSPDFDADAPALSRAGLNHPSHFYRVQVSRPAPSYSLPVSRRVLAGNRR
jgi:hypothetical protein